MSEIEHRLPKGVTFNIIAHDDDDECSICDEIDALYKKIKLLERKVEEAKSVTHMLEINTRPVKMRFLEQAQLHISTIHGFLVAMLEDLEAKE